MEKSKCTNPIGHQLREYMDSRKRTTVRCKFCGDSINKVRGIAPKTTKPAVKKPPAAAAPAVDEKSSPGEVESENETTPVSK